MWREQFHHCHLSLGWGCDGAWDYGCVSVAVGAGVSVGYIDHVAVCCVCSAVVTAVAAAVAAAQVER